MSLLKNIKPNKVTADILSYKQLIAGRPKTGKSVTNETKIPTPNGWTTMGELKEGDVVFDRLGKETNVIGVYPQGELETYRVELNDGRVFFANDEHLIPYITSRGNISSKTLGEMKDDYVYFKDSKLEGRGKIKQNKYSIPNSKEVEYPESSLPVNPYALGVLIGDGSLISRNMPVSSDEEDIVQKTTELLKLDGYKRDKEGYRWHFDTSDGKRIELYNKISDLKLNVKSLDKFIPEEYLLSSKEQRLNLLQGLMDSDGTVRVSKSGAVRFDFSTNSKKLALDTKVLAHSLGIGAVLSAIDREDKDNTEYVLRLYTSNLNIVTSKKHTEKLRGKDLRFSKKEDYAKIVNIENLEVKKEMTCIKVDNDEELFLINDYIVTHNTSLFANMIDLKHKGDMSKGLLVAFERGYQALDGVHAFDIEEWEDFQELVEELVDNKDETSYEVIGLDTIDILIQRATEYVISRQSIADKKRYGALADIAWGKGYALLDEAISTEVDKLDQAGYGLVYITHDKDVTRTTREGLEYNKTVISAGGRGGDYFRNSADLIVFIELTKEIDKGKKVDKRYIYFRGDADMEAGSRFKHAPVRVEYSAENYVNAIEGAIEKEYGSKKAVTQAKKKQAKEAKQEKKEELEAPGADELIKEIDEAVKSMENASKHELAEQLKTNFSTSNYRKMDDVKELQKVLKIIDSI